MFRYTLYGAGVTSVVACLSVWGAGLTGWPAVTVAGAALAVIAVVVLRIARLGTVVTAAGFTRRGFLADRHHPWSEVQEFELTDRQSVEVVNGFQISSRYVVSVVLGPRSRRTTLLFLDERGFTSWERFYGEVDAVAALWDRQRQDRIGRDDSR